MGMERQQGTDYQLDLFEGQGEVVRPIASGEGGTRPAALEESQLSSVSEGERALTASLMERICEPENLNRAYKKVKANRGAPGVDGMSVTELRPWLEAHREELNTSLLEGSYQPQPVRGARIPKPSGGVRP
jgi:RNA-directed DNA polymerase